MFADDQRRRAESAQRVRPDEAATAHAEAIEMRETLYSVIRAAAEGRPPPRQGAKALVASAEHLQTCRRLRSSAVRWWWDWDRGDPLQLPSLIILADAVDLLTSDDVYRLGVCAGEPFGWLFIDSTKNHSRLWCSMAGCGNRAKTRRHYQRQRQA